MAWACMAALLFTDGLTEDRGHRMSSEEFRDRRTAQIQPNEKSL